MKTIAILFSGLLGLTLSTTAATLTVERGSDLQAVIDYAQDGDTLLLGAKTFETPASISMWSRRSGG